MYESGRPPEENEGGKPDAVPLLRSRPIAPLPPDMPPYLRTGPFLRERKGVRTLLQETFLKQVVAFKNDGKKCERRPYFELTEYQKLYRFMRKYVKLTTKDSPKGGVKNRTLQVREMLRDLVLFLVNTGMRFGTEIRSLKWKHISEVTINGENYVKINLEKGKTGGRTIIARHNVRRYLNRIKDRFPHLKSRILGQMLEVDEYIFRLRDGSIPKDLHGAFEIMLTEAGLLTDVNGRLRYCQSSRFLVPRFVRCYSNARQH